MSCTCKPDRHYRRFFCWRQGLMQPISCTCKPGRHHPRFLRASTTYKPHFSPAEHTGYHEQPDFWALKHMANGNRGAAQCKGAQVTAPSPGWVDVMSFSSPPHIKSGNGQSLVKHIFKQETESANRMRT
jgi:hypothetical protein